MAESRSRNSRGCGNSPGTRCARQDTCRARRRSLSVQDRALRTGKAGDRQSSCEFRHAARSNNTTTGSRARARHSSDQPQNPSARWPEIHDVPALGILSTSMRSPNCACSVSPISLSERDGTRWSSAHNRPCGDCNRFGHLVLQCLCMLPYARSESLPRIPIRGWKPVFRARSCPSSVPGDTLETRAKVNDGRAACGAILPLRSMRHAGFRGGGRL